MARFTITYETRRNMSESTVEKPQWKKPLGRPRCGREDIIKIIPEEKQTVKQ
jgi:hypothetical protein